MRKLILEGGIVSNVIEVSDEIDLQPDWARDLPDAGDAGPGWIWDGKTLTPPPDPEPEPLPPAPSASGVIDWLHAEGIITAEERAAWQARATAARARRA